jgi:hypothetical protein
VGDALAALESHGDWLEQWEPAFRPRQPTANREPLLRFARGRLTRTATGGASFEHPLFGAVPETLADTAPLRPSGNVRHGLFTLRAAGARALHGANEAPRQRVVVHADSAEFNQQGRNVFGKFVLACDPGLRCRDECLVVTEADELVAVGRLEIAPGEIALGGQGLAVKVREAV